MSSPADHLAPDHGPDPSVAARVEQLYGSHVPLVRSICGSLLRDRVEAEDAVQQTFLSAQRALLNGSAPRDAAAWLSTIARNESLARVRARMREPLPVEAEEHGAAPDAHAVAVSRHEASELHDALAGLPAQQRDAILLREVRGFSYQEVAASLSVTTSAVESLLFRARRNLQTRLQGALAALSPAEWAQPLRELAMRLAGSGLAAPVGAKVAAVGVGTAVVTGGALVAPDLIRSGHPPLPSRLASRAPVRALFDSARSEAAPRAVVGIHGGGDLGSRRLQEVSYRQTSSGTHRLERESTSSATAARDGSSGTDFREAGGGVTVQVTSQSGDQFGGDATGSSSSPSGSDSSDTTTPSSDTTAPSSDTTTTTSSDTATSSSGTPTSSTLPGD